MNFEKDFPSLHLKTWVIGLETDVTSGTIYGQRSVLKGDDSGKYIKKIDVMTNCLDKQRVKEAILEVKQWEHHDLSKDWEVELINKLFGDEE